MARRERKIPRLVALPDRVAERPGWGGFPRCEGPRGRGRESRRESVVVPAPGRRTRGQGANTVAGDAIPDVSDRVPEGSSIV